MNRDEFKLDPRLENILAEPENYLDENGFVSAVMDRLPPPPVPQMHSLKRRVVVFGIAGVAACGASWFSLHSLLPHLIPSGSVVTLSGLAPIAGVTLLGACALAVALYPVAVNSGKALALRHEK